MKENNRKTQDSNTADSFANSWNNLPTGSVYTKDQFEDWFKPINQTDVKNKRILELGCGNASLMVHMILWEPLHIKGIDLGDSVLSGKQNMSLFPNNKWMIEQADLVDYIMMNVMILSIA